MPKIRFSQLCTFGLLSAILLLQNTVSLNDVKAYLGLPSPSLTRLNAIPAIPVRTISWQAILSAADTNTTLTSLDESSLVPTTTAKSIYVEDLTSETMLLAIDAEQPRPPASTQKLMTALIALESFSPQTVLTVQKSDILLSNSLSFTPGEQFTVEDLLKCLLISSSNEAAEVLAREYPGGYEAFIRRMNQKANEIGLLHTHFINPTGYDAVNQFMSVKDLHHLASEAMKSSLLAAIVKEPLLIITDISGAKQHTLQTTNQLLRENIGAVGIKTGTTALANEVLVSQFVIDGHVLRVVLMGSTQRYEDTRSILDWVSKTYTWIKPVDLFKTL